MTVTNTKPKERYSYSRLSSFRQCPYSWKQRYIHGNKGIDNSFSDYGKIVHEILEQFSLGKLELFELSSIFESRFDLVNWNFPHNKFVDLEESYRNKGIAYFDNFEGWDAEVLGVEQEFEFTINGYDFIGYIDLILKKDDDIIIVDHKSKSKFSSKRDKMEYTRQLYLYAYWVHEKYGKYPAKLIFNLFKSQVMIEIPFNMVAYKETIKWVLDTIEAIKIETEFKPNVDVFFCANLCNIRETCIHRTGVQILEGE